MDYHWTMCVGTDGKDRFDKLYEHFSLPYRIQANLGLMMIIFCVLLRKLRFNPESADAHMIYEPAQYRYKA